MSPYLTKIEGDVFRTDSIIAITLDAEDILVEYCNERYLEVRYSFDDEDKAKAKLAQITAHWEQQLTLLYQLK